MNCLNWNNFELDNALMQGSLIVDEKIDVKFLKGTQISFPICSDAGSLENRKQFIEQIFYDITKNCSKNEPLVFISLGSDRLLMEYFLATFLIENGFGQLYFFCVEPAYTLSGEVNKKELQHARNDFRAAIKEAYFKEFKQAMPEDRVKFLSRAQNISKFYPENANVALFESLPPYAENIKDLKKKKIQIKSKDLLGGGMVVPQEHANALVFIPKAFIQYYQSATFKFIPTVTLNTQDNEFFTLDWGCKLHSNGSFQMHFVGKENYISSIGMTDKKLKLSDGQIISVNQWIPGLREKAITQISNDIENEKLPLTQEKITFLLNKVNTIMKEQMTTLISYFIVDYKTDRAEALEYLSKHAGQHYRKNFCLKADAEKGYVIKTKDIV